MDAEPEPDRCQWCDRAWDADGTPLFLIDVGGRGFYLTLCVDCSAEASWFRRRLGPWPEAA